MRDAINQIVFGWYPYLCLTVFLLDMKSPGITVRPLRQINGGREFNEVFFDDVVVPASAAIGGVGNGWSSITAFLGNERSALQLGSYAEMLTEAAEVLQCAASSGAVGRDVVMAAWSSLVIQRWTALSIASASERGNGYSARSSLGKLQWAANLRKLAMARISLSVVA